MGVLAQALLMLLCAAFPARAQLRNLTVAVLVNSQNTAGYNTSAAAPGEFQRFAEQYLQHLQVPYDIYDVSTASPPADLPFRQLIISGHSHLSPSSSWSSSITSAVAGGVGFVNLDSDVAIGTQSHIKTIFAATGAVAGTAATQITIPGAIAPGGATPHYIAALQHKYDDTSGTFAYPFHSGADGVLRSATSTVLQNAQGVVIALLGGDPLIRATTYQSGRAVHFGTLDYLHADRFGFAMGLDDLFWRSLVWAARKPFLLRGYPRLWSVQMDDSKPGWGSRVVDLFNTNLTGPTAVDGTGGPWKVVGEVYTDSLPKGSSDRAGVIIDVSAGRLKISPHSFGDVTCGNMFWNGCTGPLTDAQWQTNMAAIDAWKLGNGGSDTIPSFARSFVAHFWNLSDNTGFDLWNRYGFRYITSIQKSGYQSTLNNNGAERLSTRAFWKYELPPKTVNASLPTEKYPFFFADDYTVNSRSGLAPRTFFLFATQYFDTTRYSRPDFEWPNAAASPVPTTASSVAQLQQYTWRHWSGLSPVQIFTHDSQNFEFSTALERQTVVQQSSDWLNANGVRHVFMDELGDYIYARNKSTLTDVFQIGSTLNCTFTGSAATADGQLIPTQVLVFQADDEGGWETVPGFTNGSQINIGLPPAAQSLSPSTGPTTGGTTVTVSGTGFTSDSTVYFGQKAASTTFVSSTTLRAVTPSGPAAGVDVRVVTVNGTATLRNGFTYVNTCPCSIWTSTATPALVDSGDTNPVELGVRFNSDVSGSISGIRFYKASNNTGVHTAHLWSNTGSLLGTATFSSETASGWQLATFSSPVSIAAGVTYVASYFAPGGHYSTTGAYFTLAGVDNAPIHLLQDGADGGNGVFSYGSAGTFPVNTFNATNYWVDVVFSTAGGGASGPSVTTRSPASGSTGVAVTTTVVAGFNKALNPATVTTANLQLLDPAGAVVPASIAYNSTIFTATLTPLSSLSNANTYTVLINGGTTGVKDTAGNGMVDDVTWSFSTVAGAGGVSIWSPGVSPSVVDSGDPNAVELGVRFRSDLSGSISAIRFYKSPANTGAHTAHLWTNAGVLLGTATFSGETATGWQQANFPSPVVINAGATYVASYFAPAGHYSVNAGFFAAAGVDSAPLHLLKDGLDGVNGAYIYGAGGVFPSNSFNSSNYWVDVVFSTAGGGSAGPKVTSRSPASGATGIAIGTTVTATFDKALNPATVTSSTVQLFDAALALVPAAVSYSANVATLSPSAALRYSTTYTVVITGGTNGVKDTAGNAMAGVDSWSFTTAPAPAGTCPCSIWPATATPASVDAGDPNAVELGVRFRSDVNGFITGVRFYKSSANTGVHVGHLWSNTGALIATATFSGETVSGWQQVTFPSAVAVTAGTSYVASYFAPNGHYSTDDLYFAAAGVDNGPLHAVQDTASASNGVYGYGGAGTFPNSTYRSRNYWVDVILTTSVGGVSGPSVASVSPGSGASGVSATTTVSATFTKALNPATVTAGNFKLLDPAGQLVPAAIAYNATTFTATLTPTASLSPGANYSATVTGGSTGVTDASGNAMTSNVVWAFSIAPPPPGTSVWASTVTPGRPDSGDASAVNIGVKVRSDLAGYITAVRFYKAAANTGTHIGYLWSSTGALLASVTFTGETGAGWQQMNFSSPVPITAGTTYVVSYYAPNGHYSVDLGFLAGAGVDNAPLHVLQDGADGGNGVYTYGVPGLLPVNTYSSSNYWVDVVFKTTP